jgi:hypothetical protein
LTVPSRGRHWDREAGDAAWIRAVGIDFSGARQIGELAVHRESVERVLAESPQSLQVILDALQEALQLETISRGDGIQVQEEEREEQACLVSLKP